MEELYRQGRVRAIGVSNFFPDRVMDFLMHHDVAPAIDRVETHPFHQQVETQAFLQDNGIQIESWGPFAEGKHDIFDNPVLRSIAEEHSRTVGSGDPSMAHPARRRGDPEVGAPRADGGELSGVRLGPHGRGHGCDCQPRLRLPAASSIIATPTWSSC
jgi:hypothetical protein